MESSNKTTSNLSRLHEDIIFNILTKLPAQELHILKFVSKSWYSIIKSPAFTKEHLHNSKPGLLRDVRHVSSDSTCSKVHNDIVPIREFASGDQYVWGSCNGLVLFGSFDETQAQLFLKNPVTKEVIELPCPKLAHCSELERVFGITYIASAKEIRVLHYCTFYDYDNDPHFLGCEMLTLGHEEWVVEFCLETPYITNSSMKIIFIDDVAHWLISENCCADFKVLSLDMIEQECYGSKIPEGCIEVFDIGGVLAAIRNVKGADNKFEVWVLKDLRKGNWAIQHVVDFEGVYSDLSALTTIDNGKMIVFKHYDPTTESDLCFAYDVQLKKKIYLDYKNSGDKTMRLLPHIDSFVSCSGLH